MNLECDCQFPIATQNIDLFREILVHVEFDKVVFDCQNYQIIRNNNSMQYKHTEIIEKQIKKSHNISLNKIRTTI